jgi:DNA-nicking Smr family endonuclease
MDFKDILEKWESSKEGEKAAGNGRFSRIIKEKESNYETLYENSSRKGTYSTGRASLGALKRKVDEDVLDLHGHTSAESITLVENFLTMSVANGFQKVRIVHGRGLHSEGGQGVLKRVVLQELRKSKYVRAYGNSPPELGGSGATWVVLQRG